MYTCIDARMRPCQEGLGSEIGCTHWITAITIMGVDTKQITQGVAA